MFDTSILFSEYRRRVLALLLLHPDERYHVREIARLTNTTAGTLHRELSKLAKSKVLLREQSGNQVYYQANRNFPIYMELTSILKKTSGLVDVLFDFLTPLAEKIEVAFFVRWPKELKTLEVILMCLLLVRLTLQKQLRLFMLLKLV